MNKADPFHLSDEDLNKYIKEYEKDKKN